MKEVGKMVKPILNVAIGVAIGMMVYDQFRKMSDKV